MDNFQSYTTYAVEACVHVNAGHAQEFVLWPGRYTTPYAHALGEFKSQNCTPPKKHKKKPNN